MNLERLTHQVAQLCRQAGDFIETQRPRLSQIQIEEKSHHNLVSYVDREAEAMLMEGFLKLIPGSGFLAEESGSQSGQDFVWIIDPLDGTTNYIHGVPVYSVSVALQQNKETILGVVLDIPRNEMFASWKGGGALLNGTPVRVSRTSKLDQSLLATGFPYHDFSRMPQYLQLFELLMHKSRGVRRLGSAALDLAWVACGRFDAFYEYSLHPWDIAAGAFIVEQAGGKVSTFNGSSEYVYGADIVAGSPEVYAELMEYVRQCFG
ncbi:MAG TPA: inositol monophosphatase family protein [Bacteroidales bacterium]|nr:inositol monophosphatase family protein [Bacteroidales bacterium]